MRQPFCVEVNVVGMQTLKLPKDGNGRTLPDEERKTAVCHLTSQPLSLLHDACRIYEAPEVSQYERGRREGEKSSGSFPDK